ncbi:MAG: pilus assembly protein PilM [Phycisphaeraceae bacterium]|nr:pilus assembly protein PilM [Phycisphaeraceae bacterium]
MWLGWSKTKVSPIGIDFGADRLKLVQVTLTDPPQLLAAAGAELPEELRGDVAARLRFYEQTLPVLLKKGGFKGRQAICSLPAYQTLVAHLQVAVAEHQDLESQVSAQLRERLNVEPARMVVRYFEVGPIQRDGGTKQEVICLAASRDAVMRYINLMKSTRLDVVGMQSEAAALLKAFAHMYRRNDDQKRTTCFIDIGSATTKVVIAHGSQMVFAKTVLAAGDQVTAARAKADGVGFMAAREARMRDAQAPRLMAAKPAVAAEVATPVTPSRRQTLAGMPEERGPLAMIEAQMAAEDPHALADGGSKSAGTAALDSPPHEEPTPKAAENDTLECLIDELQLSLRYHQSLFPGRPVEKLVFLGGEANQTQACQQIAQRLRIGAQLGDPLARLVRATAGHAPLGVDLRRPQPGWAVPLGLSLCDPDF